MTDFFIDAKAVDHIKQYLEKEHAEAMRVFVSGGGCCKRLEITPVEKPLASDVTYTRQGLTLHVEKALANSVSKIKISLDETRGLLVDLSPLPNL